MDLEQKSLRRRARLKVGGRKSRKGNKRQRPNNGKNQFAPRSAVLVARAYRELEAKAAEARTSVTKAA